MFYILLMVACTFFHNTECRIKFSSKDSGITFTQDNSKLLLSTPLSDVTGKIIFKDNDPNRVVGNTSADVITFSNGITGTVGNEFQLTGTFDPSGADKLILRDGESLEISGATVAKTVRIMPNCTAAITGSGSFAAPIQLGTNATLNLGLLSALDQPLAPEGNNTLSLTKPLAMRLNTVLNNNTLQNINLNGYELFLNNALSTVGSFNGAGTVHFLRSNYRVTDDLIFNDQLDVNGNDSLLNFDSGKSIKFGAGFYNLENIELAGLDLGTTFSVDPAGTVFLSNVAWHLNGDMLLKNQGQIVILGQNCRIFPNGYKIQLDQGTTLTVDGVDLVYYPKNLHDPSPFETIDSGSGSGAIQLLNNGRIIPNTYGLAVQDDLIISTTSFTAANNLELSGSSRIFFVNATPTVDKTITFDGAGYAIQFPASGSSESLIFIDPKTTVLFNNVTLKGFNPANFNFAANTAHVEFGNNCIIELASNLNIDNNFVWTFAGNSTIEAAGKTITLNGANILQAKDGSVVNFNNAHFSIEDATPFLATDTASTFCFQDSSITLKNVGLTLSSGNYQVKGHVQVFGADQTAIEGNAILRFSSSGNFVVNGHSQLDLNRSVTFEYCANPALDGTNTYATKRHFTLADPSAKLLLNGCSLVSTDTAFALDYGTVYVADTVPFSISTAPAAQAEFGTALLVEVLAGGCLDVNGPLKYVPTSLN